MLHCSAWHYCDEKYEIFKQGKFKEQIILEQSENIFIFYFFDNKMLDDY